MEKLGKTDGFGGRLLSKVLFAFSFILLCLSGAMFLSKIEDYDLISKQVISSRTPWGSAVALLCLGIATGWISYRLAGGKRNPTIWADMNLYTLLKHAALSGNARIGFHTLRDQQLLISKLESFGFVKSPGANTRDFIRQEIIKHPKAFEALRDKILIEMIHNGEENFWDGYGKKKTAAFFHEAEILFDIEPSCDYMFYKALEGFAGEKNDKT